MMKPVLYLVAMGMMVLALCGCSSKFVANKNYPSANIEDMLKYDKDFCHEVARGRTPVPQLQNLPERGYSVQTQGNIQGIGLYPAYYNQTTYIDNTRNYNNVAASNLGSAIGFAIAITNRENDCMERLGWVTKSQMTPAIQQMIAENDVRDAENARLLKVIDSFSGDIIFEDVSTLFKAKVQSLSPEQRQSMLRNLRKDPEKFKELYMLTRNQYLKTVYGAENDKYAKNDIKLKKIMESCSSDPMYDEVNNFIIMQLQNMTSVQRKALYSSFIKNPESFKGFYARDKKRYEQAIYEIDHPVAQ